MTGWFGICMGMRMLPWRGRTHHWRLALVQIWSWLVGMEVSSRALAASPSSTLRSAAGLRSLAIKSKGLCLFRKLQIRSWRRWHWISVPYISLSRKNKLIVAKRIKSSYPLFKKNINVYLIRAEWWKRLLYLQFVTNYLNDFFGWCKRWVGGVLSEVWMCWWITRGLSKAFQQWGIHRAVCMRTKKGQNDDSTVHKYSNRILNIFNRRL